jgi:hypothetical protein
VALRGRAPEQKIFQVVGKYHADRHDFRMGGPY